MAKYQYLGVLLSARGSFFKYCVFLFTFIIFLDIIYIDEIYDIYGGEYA